MFPFHPDRILSNATAARPDVSAASHTVLTRLSANGDHGFRGREGIFAIRYLIQGTAPDLILSDQSLFDLSIPVFNVRCYHRAWTASSLSGLMKCSCPCCILKISVPGPRILLAQSTLLVLEFLVAHLLFFFHLGMTFAPAHRHDRSASNFLAPRFNFSG